MTSLHRQDIERPEVVQLYEIISVSGNDHPPRFCRVVARSTEEAYGQAQALGVHRSEIAGAYLAYGVRPQERRAMANFARRNVQCR